MKKNKLVSVTAAFCVICAIFALSACVNLTGEDDDEGITAKFYAQNLKESKYYTVTAVQRGIGKKCEVWVDQDVTAGVTDKAVKKMINEFDNTIYSRISDAFGTYESRVLFENPSAVKLIFLVLDIKDGYNGGSVKGYVAGYFDAADLLPDMYRYSNEAPILYIDAYPNIVDSSASFSTMAHEFQHLINFVNSVKYRLDRTTGTLYLQDLWINEGLSTAAEYLYLDAHNNERIDWFNRDPLHTIAEGNNFFVFGEDRGLGKEDSILDDYASAYLFFQWLRIHGGTAIYKNIGQSRTYDSLAVITAASSKIPSLGTWETLLGKWLEANYVNDPTGLNGYKNEIKTRVWAKGPGDYPLYPGEAVYNIGGSSTPSGNLQTKALTRAADTSAQTTPYKYDKYTDTSRIVIFNNNRDAYDRTPAHYGEILSNAQETGTITGGAGETNSNTYASVSRSAQASMSFGGGGAYPVDAWTITQRPAGRLPAGTLLTPVLPGGAAQ